MRVPDPTKLVRPNEHTAYHDLALVFDWLHDLWGLHAVIALESNGGQDALCEWDGYRGPPRGVPRRASGNFHATWVDNL